MGTGGASSTKDCCRKGTRNKVEDKTIHAGHWVFLDRTYPEIPISRYSNGFDGRESSIHLKNKG